MSLEPVSIDDLEVLESRFKRAFATGRAEGLEVVGYGEITSVVAWQGSGGPVATKRLPTFPRGEGVDAYLALLNDYLNGLQTVGVDVVPTSIRRIELDGGDVAVYLLQPLLPSVQVGHAYLREATAEQAAEFLDRVYEGTKAAIGAGIGIDAQVSNWGIVGEDLVYFDVTTPLLKDDHGADRIDVDIFLASLPWFLRGAVKRFLIRGIINEYFDVRTTFLNLIAQFYKERLVSLIPLALDRANRRLSNPITTKEVERYYAKDARVWEFLQRLRRIDRWWHLKLLHVPYPLLIPKKVQR